MKRFLTIMCAAAVLLSLTACKSGEVNADGAAAGGVVLDDAAETEQADVNFAVTSPAHTAADAEPEASSDTSSVVGDSAVAENDAVSQPAEGDEDVPAVETVPLTAEDITAEISGVETITTDTDGFKLVLNYVGDAQNAEYCFGCMYTLKKLNSDGEWEAVPFAENAAFNALGYLIGSDCPQNSIGVTLADEFYAEPVTAGEYCVEMEIDGVTIEQRFTVEEPDGEYIPLGENDIVATLDSKEYSVGTESVQLTLSYVGGNDAARYVFGADFMLEKWDNSIGDWRSLSLAEHVAFADRGYEVNSSSEAVMQLNISDEMFAQEMTAGTYRIIKPLCDGVEAHLVFELKDVDTDTGLTVESASGKIELCITEVRDDMLICSLTFPSPLEYEVICDPAFFSGLEVGDEISVTYAPIYRLSDGQYRVMADSIEEIEDSDDDYTGNRDHVDY